jgi:hypothetical protein
MVWNRFSSVFSSENGSEWNSEFFFFRKWFGTVFSSKSDLERNSKVLSFKNGLEQNSKGFFIPRNGSERNSKIFLFRETGGIPTELPSVPSCFVVRGIIFLSENGNPSPDGIWVHRCELFCFKSCNELKLEHMRNKRIQPEDKLMAKMRSVQTACKRRDRPQGG